MRADVATRQAWLVWTTAVIIYVAAVFHRSSLGVAGIAAAQRFGVGPAALGTLTVLQALVYAAMQVPTGLLVDRFGPRRVLTVSCVLMGFGQLAFAIADSYALGLAARAVLGLGDALTFVSILRLVAAHFPARQYAVVVTITAALGAIGNLAATVPLTLLLESVGWTATFLVAGVGTAVYSGLAMARLRDRPAGEPARPGVADGPARLLSGVRSVWRVPGTRLSFWVHFSTMFAPSVLGLLWGVPYLVGAQGLSERAASSVLALTVIVAMIAGPALGALISRRPEWRMPLVVGYLGIAVCVWAVLLGWSGPLPSAVLFVAFGLLSLGMPVSAIAFAIVRDYNSLRRVGTATGVVNVGGFCATTLACLGVGVVLDQFSALPQVTAFRIALLVVAGMLVLGIWRTAVWWRRARAAVFAAEARGELVPVRLRYRRRWDAQPVPVAAPVAAAA